MPRHLGADVGINADVRLNEIRKEGVETNYLLKASLLQAAAHKPELG
jgi:hypothetical protein